MTDMECTFCKAPMKRSTAPLTIDRKGYHLHWNDVPAWVCTQCGEPYFELDVLDRIEAAIETLDRESAQFRASA